jgi:hypothetical protein
MPFTFDVRVKENTQVAGYPIAAGLRTCHVALNFNGEGNYTIFPQAACVGEAWQGQAFDLGFCKTEEDLGVAVDKCTSEYFANGMDDPIWALDAEAGLSGN